MYECQGAMVRKVYLFYFIYLFTEGPGLFYFFEGILVFLKSIVNTKVDWEKWFEVKTKVDWEKKKKNIIDHILEI